MTPKQRVALERLRQMRADSNSHDGGYPITEDGRFQSLIDHCSAAQIALADYPADDECEMTRQELIEELKACRAKLNSGLQWLVTGET